MGSESSQFWDTAGGVGDGADTYSAVQVRSMLRALFTTDRYSSECVLPGVLNSLAVSGASSPLSLASGCAVVNGIYYQNTGALSVAVPTPSSGTTKHRVILRATWGSTQTVRAALLSSADGTNSYPSLTQTDNSLWEVSLAGVTIDTSGVIALEDQRDYCHYATKLVYRRRGGSSSSWNSAGSNTYSPGGVKHQGGTVNLTWNSNDTSDTTTVTFPSAFSQTPLVRTLALLSNDANARKCVLSIESLSKTQLAIRGQRVDLTNFSATYPVQWLVEGAE
jgi:hypothetical protein